MRRNPGRSDADEMGGPGLMCVGIPARVVKLGPAGSHSATVDVEGVRREVNTVMVDDDGLSPGEWVLLHVGFALTKIDEAEAAETLAFMRQLGSVYDEEIEAVAIEPP